MKLLSVDVGYIGTKFCVNEDDMRITPSFVKETDPNEPVMGKILEVEGRKFIIGEAARQGKHSNFTLAPRAEDENTYLLMMAAMGEVLDPEDEVFIITGLPDKEQPIFKDQFIQRIEQIGSFTYCGKEFNIKIKGVKVNLQSKGMFYSQVFDQFGTMDDGYMNMKVGIIEMGWRTCLLSQIVNLQYIDDYCSTEELGMYNVCKDLADLIYVKFREQFFPEQLEDAVKTGLLTLYGSKEDISDLLAECFRKHVEKIIKVLGNKWPNLSQLDAVMFGGGGMQPLFDSYIATRREFQNNSTLLDRFTVVRGYHRSGLFQLGGEVENVPNVVPIDQARREDQEMVG